MRARLRCNGSSSLATSWRPKVTRERLVANAPRARVIGDKSLRPRVLGALAVTLSLTRCAGASGNDVVGPSRDVVQAGPATRTTDGYEYVAKRPLAIVALAEARGIPLDIARVAVDQIADALDVCTTEQGSGGTVPRGAARVIAQVGPSGVVEATSVRVDPGAGVSAAALLCFVAPVRRLGFPAADAGARGLAIEALWGGHAP
jgi:hypothetical protein